MIDGLDGLVNDLKETQYSADQCLQIVETVLKAGKRLRVIHVAEFTNHNTVCPTQFTFEDKVGNEYYFRLRHGYASLERWDTDEVIISGSMGRDFDGSCDPEDMVNWALGHGVVIFGVK